MSWCKLEDTFVDDTKWDLIATALSGDSRATKVRRGSICRATVGGYVAFLYSWCCRHAPDGHLGRLDASTLSRVVGYPGDPNMFLSALVTHEVLDRVADGVVVHGYRKRSESFNKAAQKQAERERKRRASESEMSRDIVATNRSVSPDSLENVAPEIEKEKEIENNTQSAGDENANPGRKAIGRTPLDHVAEHAWREREKSRGLPALPLSENDRARLSRIVRIQCEGYKTNRTLTVEALFDEWLRPEWKNLYGDSLKQLEANLRSVMNAVVDVGHRPKLKGQDGPARPFRQEQTRHVIDGVSKLNAELEANPQRISADSPVRALVMRISNNPHDHEAKAALEQFMKEQEAQHVAT